MKNIRIGRVIAYLLALAAVAGAIGVAAHFTNGFTSDFKTFYVSVNGKDIMSDSGGYQTAVSDPLKVDVKYTFGFAANGNREYSVKIVPNAVEGSDFRFTVGGETHSFQSEKDLSAGFRISTGKTSFTVTPKGSTLTEILKAVYPNAAVSDCEQYGYGDMFTVVVTSYNGEASVRLHFVIDGTATGVTLDREVIAF